MNAGIAAIERIGLTGPSGERFQVEATDNASVFTNEKRLGRFNAVVFLTGGGDVLDPAQEAGLEAYMEAGGGFVGIHDAARAEPYWTGSPVWSVPARPPPARPGVAGPPSRSATGAIRPPRTCRCSGSGPTSG
ncbi:ThuA domain-containing protein [Streptomyces thinghirensis]|nr:ThuA domain-containing protein [Streptomyces thinghirensis]